MKDLLRLGRCSAARVTASPPTIFGIQFHVQSHCALWLKSFVFPSGIVSSTRQELPLPYPAFTSPSTFCLFGSDCLNTTGWLISLCIIPSTLNCEYVLRFQGWAVCGLIPPPPYQAHEGDCTNKKPGKYRCLSSLFPSFWAPALQLKEIILIAPGLTVTLVMQSLILSKGQSEAVALNPVGSLHSTHSWPAWLKWPSAL